MAPITPGASFVVCMFVLSGQSVQLAEPEVVLYVASGHAAHDAGTPNDPAAHSATHRTSESTSRVGTDRGGATFVSFVFTLRNPDPDPKFPVRSLCLSF